MSTNFIIVNHINGINSLDRYKIDVNSFQVIVWYSVIFITYFIPKIIQEDKFTSQNHKFDII